MPQLWDSYEKLKLIFSGLVLISLFVIYADFVRELGERYPEVILDEILSGFIGIGLVLLWYRMHARLTR